MDLSFILGIPAEDLLLFVEAGNLDCHRPHSSGMAVEPEGGEKWLSGRGCWQARLQWALLLFACKPSQNQAGSESGRFVAPLDLSKAAGPLRERGTFTLSLIGRGAVDQQISNQGWVTLSNQMLLEAAARCAILAAPLSSSAFVGNGGGWGCQCQFDVEA